MILGAGGALASRLTLRSDLSSLLPPSKRSVQDLEVLRHRARSFGNVLIMVDAPTPEIRARVATVLEARLRGLDPALVATVSTDEHATARYGWRHRFLFVDLADLRAARDALSSRLRRARLEHNPLYVDMEEDEHAAEAAAGTKHLDELQRKLDDAERVAASPPMRLSADGKSQLLTVTVTFPSSDIGKSRIVMRQVRAIGADLEARDPGVHVEFAGTINISIFERDSVIAGMARAAVITIVLVSLSLLLYYRAVLPVLGALFALMVGVAITLGFADLAIGHLNLLSAFLVAIVVGNGINPALIVLARWGEERHDGHAPDVAIARALRGSLHGTLAASLTAAASYGALVVTDFRGFRDFGIIGGAGMLACWVSSYTVLPVTLGWLARRGLTRARRARSIGALSRASSSRLLSRGLLFGAGLTGIALFVTVRFLDGSPFQQDWRDLQPDGAEIIAQHAVDARMSARFDQDKALGGHSYQLAIAVDRIEAVRGVVDAVRAREAQRPSGQALFADIKSIDDLVPADQDARLALLAEIRTLFADPAIAQLDDEERTRLLRLRPPDDLRAITIADVPDEIRRQFIEQDGSIGRLIYVKGSPRFRTWNIEDRVAFAGDVRRLDLPPGVVIGGEPLVIADIVETMKHDAPIMIVISLAGSILAVWLVVGLRRHGAITLICGLSGVIVMIAACALAGLRIHFLDLIALPITIGIGIDYGVNLVASDRDDFGKVPGRLLATTGAAVLLCSFTTSVGYGSLLLSSNGGVRAFGLAALLGEASCILMALVLAPALLARWQGASELPER